MPGFGPIAGSPIASVLQGESVSVGSPLYVALYGSLHMIKNQAGQKLVVFAFDSTTNEPVTGDAANLAAYVSIDWGTVTVLADTSATEMDATNAKGYYLFDLAQAETNGDTLVFSAESSTANIVVIAIPAVVSTLPPNFSDTAIGDDGAVESNLVQIDSVDVSYYDGVAQGGDDLYITLDPSSVAQDGYYDGQAIEIIEGTGEGQKRIITGYGGADMNALVNRAWVVNPDSTSKYILSAGEQDVATWRRIVPNVLLANRVDANTQATAATLAFNQVGDQTGNIVGSITGTVAAVVSKVGFKLASDGLDLVVPEDPSVLPILGASTIVDLIGFFGACSINEINVSATSETLKTSAGAALATSPLSDNGTVFVSGEAV